MHVGFLVISFTTAATRTDQEQANPPSHLSVHAKTPFCRPIAGGRLGRAYNRHHPPHPSPKCN